MRAFRFGVVGGRRVDRAGWLELARRAERAGVSTLLAPDNLQSLAPLPALAAAAAVTERLRLATHVLAAPWHTAAEVAWQASTLDHLSDGRFELGLGAGRPGGEVDAARFGVAWDSPGRRVDALAALVEGVQAELQRPEHRPARASIPLVIAGGGPRMLALAGRYADTLALAVGPDVTEAELAARTAAAREAAAGRELELGLSLIGVGAAVSEWVVRRLGADLPRLRASGAPTLLSGRPREMADTLLRRRDATGVSYLMAPDSALDELAPVIELLAGR